MHFSGAGKVCVNTSPAPESVFKYFPGVSGAGEVSDKKYFSGAGELFKYTSPAPEKPGKYLKPPFRRRRSIYRPTHFRRRRSAYIHLSGVGEAGEAGEVFIYTT